MRVKRRFVLITAMFVIMSCIFYMGLFLSGNRNLYSDSYESTESAESTELAESADDSGNDSRLTETPGQNGSNGVNTPKAVAPPGTSFTTAAPSGTNFTAATSGDDSANDLDKAFKDTVKHKRIETEISGNEQVINLLEIDLSKGKVDVMPALSYGVIYGFENLSEIAERAGAYAAVNGGFFSVYGKPSGLVMTGGELCSASSGKYPVFVTDGSKAGFKVFQNEINISVNGGEYAIDDINTAGTAGRAVLYTPVYGSSNRADSQNVTYIIEQGKVTGSVKSKDATKIPKSGMLLTLYLPFPDTVKAEAISEITINTGDSITFEYLPYLGENANAYECGHMILENGKNVAGAYDAWIGVLTNRDPRTVIGIKNESTVVLMTVDGRQPGYSVGLTALETAEFLKEYGVTDAAMLDGGASTEMIVNGNIVNKPSFEGQERKVAGAVIVKKR